jgi:hypothetical protein
LPTATAVADAKTTIIAEGNVGKIFTLSTFSSRPSVSLSAPTRLAVNSRPFGSFTEIFFARLPQRDYW